MKKSDAVEQSLCDQELEYTMNEELWTQYHFEQWGMYASTLSPATQIVNEECDLWSDWRQDH